MTTAINRVSTGAIIPQFDVTPHTIQQENARMADTALGHYIGDHIAKTMAENMNDNVDMHAGVRSPEFMQLLNNSQQIIQRALAKPGDAETVKLVLPKSSQQATLFCMLIELANRANIADMELSSTFGIMSEKSNINAANAQQAQGMAILSKSILSSTINLTSNAVATNSAVKNYSATKLNLNTNLKGMNDADVNIRKMQSSVSANRDVDLDLDLDGSIANRNAFNTAFMQGEARTRLTATQIEAQRAIGMAGVSVADGSGTYAHGIEQKQETLERTESKVMDGAVEMSRQQAQKSSQLLASMMNLLNDIRRTEADLVSSFASNIKA